jgi:hypothetical protein
VSVNRKGKGDLAELKVAADLRRRGYKIAFPGHHYRHRPTIGETLARRQQGQDPRVIEIAQRRLNGRWRHLYRARCKPAG